MTYPQKLYRTPGPDAVVVNSDEEASAAIKQGYMADLPAHAEFPKMVYLHPVDKTKEHKFIVVNSPAELDEAAKGGYKIEPHVPVIPADEAFDDTASEVPGSGSERWPHTGWTEAGDGTNYPGLPTQAQADAVAAKADAEMTERRGEIESEGKSDS